MMEGCEYTIGMLVMRPCGMPVSSACGHCGIPVCGAHAMSGSSGMPACPRCASTRDEYGDNEDTELESDRDEYYSEYGGTSSYGNDDYFTPEELAAVHPSQQRESRLSAAEDGEDDYDSGNS
jgi:hypothetical protein